MSETRPIPSRATGRHAGVMKYDLLTALGAFGCAADKHLQRLVLRLMTLIVARYNWQADEFAVGQREIAALWAVDERTVKREMARLRDLGWVTVKRPATRGRVAVHGLQIPAILAMTRGDQDRVGPDFVARLSAGPAVPADNVVPFPPASQRPEGSGPWPVALARLQDLRPDLFPVWFAALEPAASGGDWVLLAPSRFHASFVATHHLAVLTAALRRADPGFRSVQIRARG